MDLTSHATASSAAPIKKRKAIEVFFAPAFPGIAPGRIRGFVFQTTRSAKSEHFGKRRKRFLWQHLKFGAKSK